MIRYLITDGTSVNDETGWLRHLRYWMEQNVDFIQIREPGHSVRALADLTRKVLRARASSSTRILINDRIDVAIACGADGVHLKDRALAAQMLPATLLISLSCHSAKATIRKADLILLAPIFPPGSKPLERPPLGLGAVNKAAQLTSTPILALGGVTQANQQACLDAGAAGIAGISYFSKHKA